MIAIDAMPLQTEHRYRGVGTYVAGLLDGLAALEHPCPVSLIVETPHRDDHPLLHVIARQKGIRLIRVHHPRWRRSRLQWLMGSIGVATALRRAGVDLYHATEPNGLVIARGIVTIATVHDLIPLRQRSTHMSWREMDARIGLMRYLHNLKRVDHIIADSEATKIDLIDRLHIPEDRISVAYLAVEKQRYYPRSTDEVEEIRAKHGIQRPYLLYVGSSDVHKNVAAIIKAFTLLARSRTGDHDFCIAGKWPLQAVRMLERSYPDVISNRRLHMLGFVPDEDLPALYTGATALVYPSLIEGFGLPVLEAMHCGTPVITSRMSSLPEVAADAALYVDPYRPEDIADAMRRVITDPRLREDLVVRGLERAACFSWKRTAEATLRVYQELL